MKLKKFFSIILSAAAALCCEAFVPVGNNGETPISDVVIDDFPDDIFDLDDVKQRIFCDMDGDGAVKSSDALIVLRMSVSQQPYGESELSLADVDGDGRLTSNDSLEILRYSVGIATYDSIGKYI